MIKAELSPDNIEPQLYELYYEFFNNEIHELQLIIIHAEVYKFLLEDFYKYKQEFPNLHVSEINVKFSTEGSEEMYIFNTRIIHSPCLKENEIILV